MWQSKADWKNPNWKYIPAAQTDVAKTIARVRREMEKTCPPCNHDCNEGRDCPARQK